MQGGSHTLGIVTPRGVDSSVDGSVLQSGVTDVCQHGEVLDTSEFSIHLIHQLLPERHHTHDGDNLQGNFHTKIIAIQFFLN